MSSSATILRRPPCSTTRLRPSSAPPLLTHNPSHHCSTALGKPTHIQPMPLAPSRRTNLPSRCSPCRRRSSGRTRHNSAAPASRTGPWHSRTSVTPLPLPPPQHHLHCLAISTFVKTSTDEHPSQLRQLVGGAVRESHVARARTPSSFLALDHPPPPLHPVLPLQNGRRKR